MVKTPKQRLSRHSTQRGGTFAQGITLFMTAGCPYCLKVSRILDKLNVRISIVNPERDYSLRHKLTVKGGRYQVPCLHVEKEGDKPVWMYESRDIIRYLNSQFSRSNNR